jgi:hypothetical protein
MKLELEPHLEVELELGLVPEVEQLECLRRLEWMKI